jgi:hypothetical protein
LIEPHTSDNVEHIHHPGAGIIDARRQQSEAFVTTTTTGLKWQLRIGAILVFVAGIPLFVTPALTDTYFAWTIKPPLLTAVFLGASYWSGFFLGFLASRRPLWAEARIAAPASYLFTVLTLVATLLHLDRFHLNSNDLRAVAFAWFWIVVYAGVPVSMTFVLFNQWRGREGDPSRRYPLPGWMRCPFAVIGLALIGASVLLFLLPETTAQYWPWSLTPLTARAIAAWLAAIGVASAHTAYENDEARARPALISFAVFGILQTMALARYPGDFAWTEVRGWIYLSVLAVLFTLGGIGWIRQLRH